MNTDPTLAEALVLGGTRIATAAHPLCICGRPYTPTCRICLAKPNKPCRADYFDPKVLSGPGLAERHGRRTERATKRQCPMHRGT